MMRSPPSLSEIIGKEYLYMVVIFSTEKFRYAVYRIEFNSLSNSNWSLSTDSVVLRDPLLLLGSEFPFGMAFFSFGRRIYMLGSGVKERRSRKVFIFDTDTSVFGSACENMIIGKYLPIVIQPLKPFDDRVYVLSKDMCGHDLEVFYPDQEEEEDYSAWTFIGAPSWFIFPPGCQVESHRSVPQGFLLLTTTKVVFYFDIPSNSWSILTEDLFTLGFLQPRVFAYEIGRWLSLYNTCNSSFLSSYFFDSRELCQVLGPPLLKLHITPAPVRLYHMDHFLDLGNLWFCVVQSGFDRSTGGWVYGDPVPNHNATVTVFHMDRNACSILECHSSSYKIKQVDEFECHATVRCCFVI